MDIIAEESEMNTNGSEKRKEQVSHDQSCCISVIVPVYQAESYLLRCMESIRLQTWQTYEVILVDDGSLDAGGALCDSYAQQDARIRVIHQENRGLSAARNAGIKKANGEWIAFVDADDAVAPSYLETLYQAAVMKHCHSVVLSSLINNCRKVLYGMEAVAYFQGKRCNGVFTAATDRSIWKAPCPGTNCTTEIFLKISYFRKENFMRTKHYRIACMQRQRVLPYYPVLCTGIIRIQLGLWAGK
mgnify:CR=1 FL=1